MGTRFADLRVRTLTGLALGVVALVLIGAGGIWAAIFLALAGMAMMGELRGIVGAGQGLAGLLSLAAVGAAVLVTEASLLRYGLVVLAAGAVGVLLLDRVNRGWLVGGLFWIGTAMASIEGMRADPLYGFQAVLWLFLVVIASDVGGYFGGRLIGGPRLWPRVSPKKTWAGTLAGAALACLIGAAFSRATTGTLVHEVVVVSGLTAVVAQGGDLLESALKRHFGVKDASALIPGHGGVLDRLDGLMAAGLIAGAITFARGQSVFIW